MYGHHNIVWVQAVQLTIDDGHQSGHYNITTTDA